MARPAVMPMDAWRAGDEFVVEFDLPGVDPGTVDLDVERNVLTVRAERPAPTGDQELIAAERPRGVFSRQLFLGENLDTERVQAGYEAGVLTLRIPVADGRALAQVRRLGELLSERYEEDIAIVRAILEPRAVAQLRQATGIDVGRPGGGEPGEASIALP